MPQVTFIDPDGTEHVVEAPSGRTLMQVAVANGHRHRRRLRRLVFLRNLPWLHRPALG